MGELSGAEQRRCVELVHFQTIRTARNVAEPTRTLFRWVRTRESRLAIYVREQTAMNGAPFPPSIRRRVIELRREGKTPAEVRELTGVSRQTQASWLPKDDRVWPQETIDRCRELRGHGYGYAEIQRVTGVPRQTQREWYSPKLRAMHDRRKKPPIRIEGIKEITYKGLRYKRGQHDRLFYLNELNEWVRSTLGPEEVGFIPRTAARPPGRRQSMAQ